MQILQLLAFYAVFSFKVSEPASLLKGGEDGVRGNTLTIKMPTNLPLTTAETYKSSSKVDSSDSDDSSTFSTFLGAVKNLKGRRRFTVTRKHEAWNRMNALTGSPGYIIRLYRSRSEDRKPPSFDFKSTPDDLSFTGSKTNKVLIQSEINAGKRLCIFSQDPFQEHTVNLENFVKDIIAAGNDERKQAKAFKSYKKRMGLPKFGFDYTVYAWETEADCAFYNLGTPMRNSTDDPNKLTRTLTGVASEVYADKTYTIQISQTHVPFKIENNFLANPIEVLFMNRYYTGKPINNPIRLKPVKRVYESLRDMYIDIGAQFPIVESIEREIGDKACAVQFLLSDKKSTSNTFGRLSLDELVHHVDKSVADGIAHFRTQAFGTGDLFSSTFDAFGNGADTVILATWKPVKGSCNFPDDETEMMKENVDVNTAKAFSSKSRAAADSDDDENETVSNDLEQTLPLDPFDGIIYSDDEEIDIDDQVSVSDISAADDFDSQEYTSSSRSARSKPRKYDSDDEDSDDDSVDDHTSSSNASVYDVDSDVEKWLFKD